MKFFIDTAKVEEIREAKSWGILDGVTTNPSHVADTGRKFYDVLLEICSIVDGPISAEVTATDAPGMIREAREIVKLHKNIVIKMPVIREGINSDYLESVVKLDEGKRIIMALNPKTICKVSQEQVGKQQATARTETAATIDKAKTAATMLTMLSMASDFRATEPDRV